jgi:SagB-type dehydrogenase family enzyme
MKKLKQASLIFAMIFITGIVLFMLFRGVTPTGRMAGTGQEGAVNEVVMEGNVIKLPAAERSAGMSLNEALNNRRSVRRYSQAPVDIGQVSQLLWSAQGTNNERGFRTAPSAGATFPLEMYVMANNITGLERGIYHYNPFENTLELIRAGSFDSALMRASLSQSMIVDAAMVMIFAAVFERTTRRYNERGIRYVYNEIGHAGQNVHLQAAALNLGTVVIGAYNDEEVEAVLNLGDDVRVLYLMPVGVLD